ncbi:antibiotic biosynthesis monooxygenase [Mesorhizobium plurifarium]|uniref:antibiotic biosynthesis monooxygenase family protein n=1 Tax=Sinorhizobium arboris TaxID=76745 RepID=UPI0003FD7CCE|nr:antibiotic biosynthesis monooxygenase [Sinorhizobium arboris]PST26379.1 antibiotic biosynthesis monooxygenase [Mesorhizobium plurifarium]
MIAVIFEVLPTEGRHDAYLKLAGDLRPLLDGIDGFISIERFRSLTNPEKLLSLSFWRDETAVKAWRNCAEHRAAQAAGRRGVFADYRLRIAAVVRDYGLDEREAAPPDSRRWHDANGDS